MILGEVYMKKHLFLVWEFYSGSITPLIIIMIVMTFAQYTFTNVMGISNYIGYSKKVFNESSLENALYYIPAKNEDYYALSTDEQKAQDAETKEKLLEIDGVEELCVNRAVTGRYHDKYVNFILYDDAMLSRFKLSMDKGEWLSGEFTNDCVIGGSLFNDVDVGDEIECLLGNGSISLKISGKMSYPAYIPQMLGGDSAEKLFRCYDNVILMVYSPYLIEQLKELDANVIEYENYFVVLNPEISDDNKKLVTDILSATGRYLTYDEIIDNTDKVNDYRIKTKLPMPLYAFVISSVSVFSLSLLMTQKKIGEFSVYYIVGCSKKKVMALIATALSAVSALPCLLNIANILIDPYLFRTDDSRINKANCYIDNRMIIPLIAYTIFIVAVTVGAALSTYRNKSVADILRRVE